MQDDEDVTLDYLRSNSMLKLRQSLKNSCRRKNILITIVVLGILGILSGIIVFYVNRLNAGYSQITPNDSLPSFGQTF